MKLTSKERQARYNQKFKDAGLKEVRGVYVKEEVRTEAREIIKKFVAENSMQ